MRGREGMVSTGNTPTTLHFTLSSRENLGAPQRVAYGQTATAQSSTKQTPPPDWMVVFTLEVTGGRARRGEDKYIFVR